MAAKSSGAFGKALTVLLPTKLGTKGGLALSPTFQQASPDTILTLPTYRNHLTDLFTSRASSDSKTLMKELMVSDPDTSAATHAFLTVADTVPLFLAKTVDGKIDRPAMQTLNAILLTLFSRFDYQTVGFEKRHTLSSLCEAMRYMVLLRGAIASEMIIDATGVFSEIRLFDSGSIQWFEKENGRLYPRQFKGSGDPIELDYNTIFYEAHRADPTTAYTNSMFVSAINTIASRQQIINDLYRLMAITGYPRMTVEVMEEVIVNNLPLNIRNDATERSRAVQQQLAIVSNALNNLRPDESFVHTNSVKVGMINEGKSGMTLDITPVIKTLNAQNQSGLKTMATVLGRGESGVNTATVEARIFSLTAEQINNPISDMLSKILTMALRMTGSTSYVEAKFAPVELRPSLELESHRTLYAARMREDLSLGIISDEEYCLLVHGRLPLDGAPVLSGTGFNSTKADVGNISPNADPLGRSIAPKDGNAAKSNAVKK